VTLSQVVSIINQKSASLRQAGATSLYIFGSYAREENKADSDLDIFVDYDPNKRFSLLDLAKIERMVEEQLKVPVDATTRDSLNPLLRDRIEAEAIRVI
jgi:predicted nucleotidyltransferase